MGFDFSLLRDLLSFFGWIFGLCAGSVVVFYCFFIISTFGAIL